MNFKYLGFLSVLCLSTFAHGADAPCDPKAVLNDDFYSRYKVSFYFEEALTLKVDRKIQKKLSDSNKLIPTSRIQQNWISIRLGSPKHLYIVPSENGVAVTYIPQGTTLVERERPEHAVPGGLTMSHEKFPLEENDLKIDLFEILYFTNWGDDQLKVKHVRKLMGAKMLCAPR